MTELRGRRTWEAPIVAGRSPRAAPSGQNPISLTCVKLDRVGLTDAGAVIHVLAADLRDGAPTHGIKFYIPFSRLPS